MTSSPPRGDSRKPRVAVVFGGRSSEHASPASTAGSVLSAIDRERTTWCRSASPPTAGGCSSPATPERLADHRPRRCPRSTATRAAVVLAREADATGAHGRARARRSRRTTLGEVDVVFPLLHGPWGEDGTIQGLLEMAGVRYVGSGVLASAVGMDKALHEGGAAGAGLPVLPYVVISRARVGDATRAAARERSAALGYPVFVKPARGGSSIGHHQGARPRRARGCRRAAPGARPQGARRGRRPRAPARSSAVCSRRLDGGARDDAGRPRSRVDGEHEFYDFAAKYLPEEGTELDVPADLPDEVAEPIQRARRPGPSRRSAARGWRGSTSS